VAVWPKHPSASAARDEHCLLSPGIKSGKVGGCGRTEFNGNTDVASALAGMLSRLPVSSHPAHPRLQMPPPRASPLSARTAPSR
jgi:hypothetical protein